MTGLRLLALLVGGAAIAVTGSALLTEIPGAIAFAPVGAAGVLVALLALLRSNTRGKKLLRALVWILFTASAGATFLGLHHFDAARLPRVTAALFLFVSAGAAMRSGYLATYRRRNGMSDYFSEGPAPFRRRRTRR